MEKKEKRMKKGENQSKSQSVRKGRKTNQKESDQNVSKSIQLNDLVICTWNGNE